MTWRRRIEPFARPLIYAVFRMRRGLTLGVRAVVTDEAGKVLLVEHTYLKGWYLPGGGVEALHPGDHVLLYRVDAWEPCASDAAGEILAVGWFAPDALPESTTPATRRRIAEALAGQEPDVMW
jgi:hypothetical protein